MPLAFEDARFLHQERQFSTGKKWDTPLALLTIKYTMTKCRLACLGWRNGCWHNFGMETGSTNLETAAQRKIKP